MFKSIFTSLLICLISFPIFSETHFLLMGSPGSGKGALTRFIQAHGDYQHLCLGDLLRGEIEKESAIGKICKSYVEAGDLVPKDILYTLFEEHFCASLNANKKLIVDGLVQSEENIQFFDALMKKYGLEGQFYFVYLSIDAQTAVDRLLNRLVCQGCGIAYGSGFSISQTCPSCGDVLVKRIDDNNKTILKRIQRFFNSTIFLVDHYRGTPFFVQLDGTQSLNVLFNASEAAFFGKN